MKKKDVNILRIIIAVLIILYLIFGTDLIKDMSKNTALASKISNSDKTTTKKVISDGELNVYFIDVGQADSILITNKDHNILIDAGNNEDGKKLVDYFKSLNITSFDYVFGTHPHEDHIGGMDDIINNFDIDKYYMPDKLSTSKTFEDVLDALINKNLKYTVPKEDEVISFNDASIDVIYVDSNSKDANDSSIVLKLTYGENSFLFTGDASTSVENKILNKNIKSDVLKIGHHGSEYSTSDKFLDMVNPKYAIIEVGTDNIYKHPKQIILDRLNIRNIKTYRTDLDGTIIVTTNGTSVSIKTEKTDTNG